LAGLLDSTIRTIKAGRGVDAIQTLCEQLTRLNAELGEKTFAEQIIPACRAHEVFSWIQQDPYSRRAFEKPRGYAGDAVMLDFVYRGDPGHDTSEIGRLIFHGTTRTSNGLSVIERRERLASLVDETAARVDDANVVSLAAGHLREAELSKALQTKTLRKWTAIDQDPDSLAEIKRHHDAPAIELIQGSVADLLCNRLSIEPCDLVYSAGLFDYLTDRIAARTLSKMLQLLRPGGKLVVTNFTPWSMGRYFMEAFMDWTLIYRSGDQLIALLRSIPSRQIADRDCYLDRAGNVAYLVVTTPTQATAKS
jgi:phospholipid N-methyltransferase